MATRLTTLVVLVIVAGSLIAGLIVGAQRDDNEGPVDLIVHNAVIHAANGDTETAEAAAIRGNQILRVGTDREITRLKRPQTIVIDAKGATVLPGFNDAHVELIEGGLLLGRVNLLETESAEDVERRISHWAEANPSEPWVRGRGWRPETFSEGLPTRAMLDRLVPDRPAYLESADGTMAWVNTRALQLAKITKRSTSPAGGFIVRDARSSEPSGVLGDAAMDLVSALLPQPSASDRRTALTSAIAEAHRYGITSLQDTQGTIEDFASYAEARRTGDLRMRIYSALPLGSDLPDADLDALEAATAKYPDDPLFKSGAISVRVEGARAPASAATHTGPPSQAGATRSFEPDVLNKLMRRLDAREWQIFAEARTEEAVGLALNAYTHAARSNPTRTRERRHRIENAMAIASDDLPRFGALGVLTAMRPAGAPAGYEPGFGPLAPTPALSTIGPLAASLLAAKGRLALGSGWPAMPLDPLSGLRRALEQVPGGTGEPASVPLTAMIDAYTSGAAWASFDEQRKGTIAPGMLADLVVLSTDVFKTGLASARVELTIFDGKVVYRRTQGGTN